jgi:OOP family OmpA-OmpF porin
VNARPPMCPRTLLVRVLPVAPLSAALVLLCPSEASAQQAGEFSVQRFEAAPGPNNVLSTERVRMVEQFGWSASVLFNYAREPFVVVSCVAETDCDEPNAAQLEDVPVVQNMFQWDVMGSFNPIEWMQIGLKVPLVYVTGSGIDTTSGQPLPDGQRAFGLGDVMVEGKFRFFGDAASLVALGGAVDVAAPLGHVTAENSYIGNDAPVTVGWRGIVDLQIEDFFTAVNLRGVYRGENTLGTTTVGPVEFRYAVGLGYQITPIFKVMAEGFGTTQFSSQNGTNTLEADGAVVISPLATGLDISVGGGAGIIEGVGVPLFRVIGGLSFKMEAGDEDGDGIGDNSDKCPSIKEDKDGFQDEDGCAEDDNDRDGIVDAKDKCKEKPETINGFGRDSDGDGVLDRDDACPTLREDRDGFEDADGCPEADNDKDGIPDEKDRCRNEAETFDGFQDEDGCPDPDDDGDGILDGDDKCRKRQGRLQRRRRRRRLPRQGRGAGRGQGRGDQDPAARRVRDRQRQDPGHHELRRARRRLGGAEGEPADLPRGDRGPHRQRGQPGVQQGAQPEARRRRGEVPHRQGRRGEPPEGGRLRPRQADRGQHDAGGQAEEPARRVQHPALDHQEAGARACPGRAARATGRAARATGRAARTPGRAPGDPQAGREPRVLAKLASARLSPRRSTQESDERARPPRRGPPAPTRASVGGVMGGPDVRVRASAVRVREQFVLARYGRLAQREYRDRASPELARVFATPGDVWVDFELFIEATSRICTLFGDGSPTLARAVGAFGAEANMGPWRSFVHKMLSPKTVLDLAGMLWSHHYDAGRLASSSADDREVTVRIEDFPRPHVLHCASIEGWCERTLSLGRPRTVTVRQTACRVSGDPHCQLEARWE